MTQKQLFELKSARKRLNEVLLERNQVVDFLAEHANNGKKQKNQSIQIERRYDISIDPHWITIKRRLVSMCLRLNYNTLVTKIIVLHLNIQRSV